ncbi:MAG: type II toxin-antitoxin system HicB family antitoxin [Patescibacteria group bacterium]
MKTIDLQTVVWKEGKHYVSQCLDVDVSSFGKTKKEALKMLQEALELYFQDQPFPQKSEIQNPVLTSITLQHA